MSENIDSSAEPDLHSSGVEGPATSPEPNPHDADGAPATAADPRPMGADSAPATGLDLRPLGADSDSAPGVGATPLVPLERDVAAGSYAHDNVGAWLSVLPAIPQSMSRDAARATRTALDPVGHWDAIVACPVRTGPQGESSPLLGGALHLFLTPGSLMRQIGGPSGAERVGLKVTRGRLLTLLAEGLNAGTACAGFWIHGMEDEPRFLPYSELEPLAETIDTVLLLARASTGGLSLADAVGSLSTRSFFRVGGWKADSTESGGEDLPSSAATDLGQSVRGSSSTQEEFRLLPLYVSPVSLLTSGHLGHVATVRLDEVAQVLEGYDGVVVEPGTGYALTLSRAQLPGG